MKRTDMERRTELFIGRLVRIAVILAAGITLAGGALYLFHYGSGIPEYRTFRGEPQTLRVLSAIVRDAASGNARGIIQCGIIVLIAIPLLRVTAFGVAFLARKDRLYAAVSAIVLCILLVSLLGRGG